MRPVFVFVPVLVFAAALSTWLGFRAGERSVRPIAELENASERMDAESQRPSDPASAQRRILYHLGKAFDGDQIALARAKEELSGVSDAELPELLKLAESMRRGEKRTWLIRSVIGRLARVDPGRMYAYCLGKKGLHEHMHDVFAELAKRDPDHAWQLLQEARAEIPPRVVRSRNYAQHVIMEWSRQDWEGAFEAATADSTDKGFLVSAIAGLWPVFENERSRKSILARIVGLPEGEVKNHLGEELARTLFRKTDAEQTQAWLESLDLDDHFLTNAEIQVYFEWYRDEPVAAADWLASQVRDAHDRFKKFSHMEANWGRIDPEAYVAWMRKHGHAEPRE